MKKIFLFLTALLFALGSSPTPTHAQSRVPGAPTGVTAVRTPEDLTEVRVSWNAVSGADSYKIDWTFTPGEVFSDGTSSTTTFTSTDKSTDETLYFWVLAVNAAGESERSARVTVGPVTR